MFSNWRGRKRSCPFTDRRFISKQGSFLEGVGGVSHWIHCIATSNINEIVAVDVDDGALDTIILTSHCSSSNIRDIYLGEFCLIEDLLPRTA